MEIQPSIKQFFKSRKRPVSSLKKDQDVSDRPSKVFVTEKTQALEKVKSRHAKVVYARSVSTDAEVGQFNNPSSEEKQTILDKKVSGAECRVRPSTPENFITVEPPLTPNTLIRNSQPTTPSHRNVLPERPATPEANVDNLEAIQKETLTGINDLKKKSRIQKKLLSVKQSLERLNQQNSRLEAIQNALRETDIDLPRDRDEPISPRKGPLRQRLIFPKEKSNYSLNQRYVSPRKLLLDGPVNVTSPTKEPAYKRFADLSAIQEKGTLILPYKYRSLAEVFRTVETIVSMIHTRGENITLEKLQAGFQSMTRKVLTLHHLGQIKTVLPNAYSFHVEKFHKFGTQAGASDKYELLIKPILKSTSNESSCSMNSALLLNRRRDFNKKLMDLTKQYHEEFLLALVPPVFLDKERLTRWHPDFELEKVPDIKAQDIPLPKSQVVNTSAKQLLDRARNLLNCNKKLGFALGQIQQDAPLPGTPTTSNNHPSAAPQTPNSSTARTPNSSTVETPTTSTGEAPNLSTAETPNFSTAGTPNLSTDKTPSSSTVEIPSSSAGETPTSSAGAVAEELKKVIKGIPKGLLEKVRARQAAKALAAMTQSPADIQEAVMLSRLPEIARILRALYVAEKRSVLLLDSVVHRIAHSSREHLSPAEIRKHLTLLSRHAPEWASFQTVRAQEFYKLAKDQNLNTVIAKLQDLAKTKDKTL